MAAHRAKVQFYALKVKGSAYPLKIDFVEDVFFDNPTIKKFSGVPVYGVNQIYLQKIFAIIGTRLVKNNAGREITAGRREVRDVVDIYFLSKRIEPLHLFLKKLSREQQRGVVQWYRSFSRQEFKLGFLDLDFYNKRLDSSRIILCLESEVKKFMREVLE